MRTRTIAIAIAVLVTATPVWAAELPPGGTFTDDDGSVHEADIEAIAAAGITTGCAADLFCPDDTITRGQMAAFLHRALSDTLTPGAPVTFVDTAGTTFEADIAWLAATGITRGCTEDRYCPDEPVSRGQMAAFLVRAFDLPPSADDPYTDSDGTFHDDINALAAAGITAGCSSTEFCPDALVTRAQMASFLTRALGLTPLQPPPTTGGCGGAPPVGGEHAITVGGETRNYLLDLPPSYDDATPHPLVFGFHGAGGTGAIFRAYGDLLDAMGAEAIVVHPDAGDSMAWNAANDIEFFDAMLSEIEAAACVDRVFVTGHSSGGFMSNQIGCNRGEVVDGIGPVAGGGPFFGSCDGAVPAIVIHGDPDPIVDFSVGVASRDRWLDLNGCGTASTSIGQGGVEYEGCEEPVRWFVHDQGHDWPDFAPEVIWDFFAGL